MLMPLGICVPWLTGELTHVESPWLWFWQVVCRTNQLVEG
jgi:hypothetical protein